jgi:hypothetical protein
MNRSIVKNWLLLPMIFLGALNSLHAHSESIEAAMAKVTIVVDGMMKSKSGAT